MGRPPILSVSDIEEIKKFFLLGKTIRTLAAEYQVDRKSIYFHLQKAGLVTPKVIENKVCAVRAKKPKSQTQKSVNEFLDKKAKYLWLWKEEEKKPLSYAEYCKKKGINLKKYFNAHGFTQEEKLHNKGKKWTSLHI